MENLQLLLDSFNIYYNQGMEALQASKLEIAKRNFFSASDTLLKLAKNSYGGIKAQRLKRAEEIFTLAQDIEKKIIQSVTEKNTTALQDYQKFIQAQPNLNYQGKGGDADLSKFFPVEKPNIKFDDVAGLQNVKDEINRTIIQPLKFPELYKKYKKKMGGGILLYGVPGTGKTMIAQAIATEINAVFYSIKCSDLVSKFVGDSEQNVRNLFIEARKHPVSIIFFDEFEALGTKRDSYSTVMKRLVPELLSQIQGFEKSKNLLLVIAASNRPWDIDTAFLRPGRFEVAIHVPLPDKVARKKIIETKLRDIPMNADVSIDEMVDLTEGFNGADVSDSFIERLKDFPIQRAIAENKESPITKEDVLKTAKIVKSSVHMSDLKKIAEYEQNQYRG
jgi:SpoVK/Ycf46/Vps4 family AAA+-type ATPase